MTKCDVCGEEFQNVKAHQKLVHPEKNQGNGLPPVTPDLNEVLGSVTSALNKINQRLTALEVKSGAVDESFKREAKEEDIIEASKLRVNVDPRVCKIVDEMLGEDFGIEMKPRDGMPGIDFTLVVPRRLSHVPESTRPVIDPETGGYKLQKDGKKPVEENYWPGDRRTKALSGNDSFDMIREHCERVRGYIVSYYQKLNRPLPQFKVKQYA